MTRNAYFSSGKAKKNLLFSQFFFLHSGMFMLFDALRTIGKNLGRAIDGEKKR